jgi:hypothetical protein
MTSKLPYIKEINAKDRFYNKNMTFKTIIDLYYNTKQILLPPIQGNLNEDTVDELVDEYLNDNNIFKCKNSICIGVLLIDKNYDYYLVDGQHRVEMAKKIFDSNDIDDIFSVNFYFCESKLQLKRLFNSLNKDSSKLNIWSYEFADILEEAKIILNSDYKHLFTRTSGKDKKIYTVDEFIIKINDISNCLKNINSGKKLIKKIIKKNIKFNTIVNSIGYKQLLIDFDKSQDKKDFYSDEKKILNLEPLYSFSLKNNNFFEWLTDKKNISPIHTNFKERREAHDKNLREKVWIHDFGKKTEAKCPIYKCKNIISKTNYVIGHIISVKNKGETVLSNLRSICNGCNLRMGSMNWKDYEKKLIDEDKENSDSDSDD